MLFNSFDFLVFFSIFYIVFYATKGMWRHLSLFIASCIFYAWFIPKYLLVLFTLIAIDYGAALGIDRSEGSSHKRKYVLLAAVLNTCAVLFIFKYHNFFADNLNSLGFHFAHWNLILPIGLSFHTFQSLSYVIDVYRKKIKAERNLLIYANYVMMFPQLVAGPIERGAHLLPQLKMPFAYPANEADFATGIAQFCYGLFKKIVVADTAGLYVDAVYNHYTFHTGSTLLLATLLFSIQIYADFSGYSDMAIGVARILGLRFNENFRTPYFSRSITEFWRRWHISLSSWLRDYLYYPLVFSFGKITKKKMALATLITFGLIGLWHGANWTFVIFGLIHGTYLVVELAIGELAKKLTLPSGRILAALAACAGQIYVFLAVSLSFIFFRSPTLTQALSILKEITTHVSFKDINLLDTTTFGTIVLSIALLFISEYAVLNRHSFEQLGNAKRNFVYATGIAVACLLLALSFGQIGGTGFIYFQF